jgi:hypothetical protein
MNFKYNKNVMDRFETIEYLNNKLKNNERVVIGRYADGEYLSMSGSGESPNENSKITRELLLKSIKEEEQLVCINFLKEKNKNTNDIWCKTQEFLINNSNHNLYGCAAYSWADFLSGSSLISKFFKGNVLIVTGHSDICHFAFKDLNFNILQTPKSNASLRHKDLLEKLETILKNNSYDNIIFCCGQVGKYLISESIKKCDSNLIDLGSIINAILYKHDPSLIKKWPMSWTNGMDILSMSEEFFKKIKNNNIQ